MRPKLEYDLIFSSDKLHLRNTQIQFAWIRIDAKIGSRYDKTYKELLWSTLNEHEQIQKVKLAHKRFTNNTTSY